MISGKKLNNIIVSGCYERIKDSKNYRLIEVEVIFFVGSFFFICVDEIRFILIEFKKLCYFDIIKDGYFFYVGLVSLKSFFEIIKESLKRVYIKFNNIKAVVVKVYVNGKKVCIFFV